MPCASPAPAATPSSTSSSLRTARWSSTGTWCSRSRRSPRTTTGCSSSAGRRLERRGRRALLFHLVIRRPEAEQRHGEIDRLLAVVLNGELQLLAGSHRRQERLRHRHAHEAAGG